MGHFADLSGKLRVWINEAFLLDLLDKHLHLELVHVLLELEFAEDHSFSPILIDVGGDVVRIVREVFIVLVHMLREPFFHMLDDVVVGEELFHAHVSVQIGEEDFADAGQ